MHSVDKSELKYQQYPAIGRPLQYCEIDLQEFAQIPTLNVREKSSQGYQKTLPSQDARVVKGTILKYTCALCLPNKACPQGKLVN